MKSDPVGNVPSGFFLSCVILFSVVQKETMHRFLLLIFGLVILSACAKTVAATPPTTAAISPVILPTETNLPVITATLPDTQALSNLSPGIGGTGELIRNPLNKIQAAINAIHYGVVYSGDTASVESAYNGTNLCFSPIPVSIYDPDHAPGPQGDLLVRQENGMAKYGFNQVLAEVLLPKNTASETYSCVLGYALSGNQEGYIPGTLRMLLARTNSNGTIDIVGSMQAGFSSSENVQVREGVVFVNGEKQEWTLFPNMVLTTPTKTPTLRPTDTLIPTEAAPNVIFGLAKTAEDVPDLGSMDKLIEAAKYFAALPAVVASDQFASFSPTEYPDVSIVSIGCNNSNELVGKILATTRVGDHYYLITQISTKTGPKNLLLYLGGALLEYNDAQVKNEIIRLNSYLDSSYKCNR